MCNSRIYIGRRLVSISLQRCPIRGSFLRPLSFLLSREKVSTFDRTVDTKYQAIEGKTKETWDAGIDNS